MELVKFQSKDGVVTGVKVLCETDFVAKNEKFQGLITTLLARLHDASWSFDFDSVDEDLKESLDTFVKEHVGTIGESLKLDSVFRSEKKGYVYNHTGNTISAVVFYDSDENVDEIAKEVALQVAAMNPAFVSMDDVPAETKKKLNDEYTLELADSNKPDDIKLRIVEGKIFKFLQDDVLLEQPSIRDGSKKIKDVIGNKLKISSLMRITVG